MNIRMYLNCAIVIASGGVIVAGEGNNSGMKYLSFGNRKVPVTEGESYISFDSNSVIPDDLSGFVLRFTCVDSFPATTKRQSGEYNFRSATAILREEDWGKSKSVYNFILSAEKLEDMKMLHELVRAGKIWPDVDYEAKQVPPPFRHARDLVRELWQIVCRDVSNKLYGIKARLGS